MLSALTSRPALAASTSVAALCLGLFVILPQQQTHIAPAPVPAPVTGTARTEPLPAQPKTELSAEAATDAAQQPAPGDTANIAAPVAPQPAPAISALPRELSKSGRHIVPDAIPQNRAPQASGDWLTTEITAEITSESALVANAPADTEAFANAAENPVKVTAETPVSTFSADVDTASYAVIRSSVTGGALPPPDAVRIEEMVNYFPYSYPAPDAGDAPFRASVDVMPTPWNKDTKLVRIGLQGRMPAMADRPPLNLVFLVDTSGSMDEPNKLPLLQQSLRLMLDHLRPEDQIAIVAYAGAAGEVLAPTPASDKARVIAALDQLMAGGSTAGAEGLELAYRTAETMATGGEVTRIVLATDGAFNVGISDPEALKDFIARKRDEGSYLSVLGFGRGNLDDATMQALAQNGNGQAAYIDTLQEARKVLVDQLSGALFPIADDVKLQVEWNPAQVAEYRLIGYETRALAREDFSNDKVDAGEIGAGHTVTALYEVTAPSSPALRNDPLRYAAAPATTAADPGKGELGLLRLRYKAPGKDSSSLIETPILATRDGGDADARFAAAIAGFGQLLREDKYLGDWGWDQAITLANENRGADEFGYRTEAVNLMRLAKALSGQ